MMPHKQSSDNPKIFFPACASGFISNDIERQLSNVTQYPQMDNWSQWRAEYTLFPHLQIWRRTEADTYTSVNATELFVPGGTERAFSRYVFNGSIDPPLEFQEQILLGYSNLVSTGVVLGC